MPTEEGRRRRSSPYDSSKDRGSHRHKDRTLGPDNHSFKRKQWNQNRENYQYQKGSARDAVRDYGGKTRKEDYVRTRHEKPGRHHRYNGDEEKRNRHASPTGSDDNSPTVATSLSTPPFVDNKRKSGFDVRPAFVTASPSPLDQVAGVSLPQAVSALLPNMFISETNQVNQLGSVSLFPVQSMSQQATRHARRVYVGGLPPLSNEQTISKFFSHVMNAIGGNSAGPGDAVVNVYINHEKKFAFVEMRTVEEASNAMALDGITFEGVSVRVRRPTDYNPTLAAALGPSQPSPHLNLAAAGLTPGITGEADGADRIFLGGVPYYFAEAQIKELLESFGPLRGFDLVKDRDTGNSKGYGFCVYMDSSVTDIACAALNGLKVGDKTLTVRRATVSGQLKSEQEHVLAQAQQHIAIQKLALGVGNSSLPGGGIESMVDMEIPTKILRLAEVVTTDELTNDEEYGEILEDMKEECQKFGKLLNVVIPRALHSEGFGKVFLEYSDTAGCAKAKLSLSGRKFGGNAVVASYYPEDKYYGGDFAT